ncbi:MAG: phosphatidylcholine/phosphatidylserine synthase, partial [Mesorhizobium sp.]
FLDGIDGRLARMLKATSKFGAQMDSLADIVNFGVAPALVLYAFLLDQAGSPGWIAALLFTIACGLRLARFNVLDEETDRPQWQTEYFVGVPAPAGAVLVMLPLYLYFLRLGVEPSRPAAFIAAGFTVLVAFLLVSRLPVYSGKSLKVPGDKVLLIILGVVLYILLLMTYPWYTLTASVAGYLLFLPFSVRAYSRRAKREGEKVPPSDIG